MLLRWGDAQVNFVFLLEVVGVRVCGCVSQPHNRFHCSSDSWSPAAEDTFEVLSKCAQWKELQAEVKGYDAQSGRAIVVLIDSSGPEVMAYAQGTRTQLSHLQAAHAYGANGLICCSFCRTHCLYVTYVDPFAAKSG